VSSVAAGDVLREPASRGDPGREESAETSAIEEPPSSAAGGEPHGFRVSSGTSVAWDGAGDSADIDMSDAVSRSIAMP